ncbi:MAG: caspase family protein [Candidatus Tectomicrobia bacterium]|nr:caspase family protein [Candidatus Tectomicrobia bacterium]
MLKSRWLLCPLALLPLVFGSVAAAPAEAVKRALLVGVGDYADSRVPDLEGPPHDVAALHAALVQHGGFAGEDIVVLRDGEGTKHNILRAIARLGEASRAGDFVLVYLSGHGTSAFDPTNGLRLPHHTGAFVPVDFAASGSRAERLDSLVVGVRDLRPLLQAIDDKGVRGLILVDSCYSQYTSRAAFAPQSTVYRALSVELTVGLDDITFDAADLAGDAAPPYPYRYLATLTASSKREKAIDVMDPRRTLDGRPHGAFTDSLLRTLRQMDAADADNNGTVSNSELFAAVRARMSAAGYPHSPQILPVSGAGTGPGGLLEQAAFAGPEQPGAAAPEVKVDEPLRVDVQGTLPQVRAAVRRSGGLVADSDAPDLRVARSGGVIRLLTAGGDVVFAGDNEAAMIHALRQQAWVQRLLRTPNDAQRFQIDVHMDGYCGETFEDGDMLGFSTRMDRAAYLALVDAAPDGTLRVLYPFYEHELEAVPAGRPVRVGNIRVGRPFGIDYVVAAGFAARPRLYDARLLNGAALQPGSRGHRELAALLQAAGDPNLARQVIRVVTVPSQAPGFRGCD